MLQYSFFPWDKETRKIKGVCPDAFFLQVLPAWVNYFFPQKELLDFSDDCSTLVCFGYVTMYAMLQLAIYMGFEEIILIGSDGLLQPEKTHIYGADVTEENAKTANFASFSIGLQKGYAAMKRETDKRGVRIINASHGGYLEMFPRVDFDTLFKERKELD